MADDPQAQEGEVQEEATDMAQAPQEEAEAVAGGSETVTEENGDGGAEEEAAPVEVTASEPEEEAASPEAGEGDFAQMLSLIHI